MGKVRGNKIENRGNWEKMLKIQHVSIQEIKK